MCIILFAYKCLPRYPLVLAANRDEYYDRSTAPAAFWPDAPDVLGGRDLHSGGTWFGMTKAGKIAALANYRDPSSFKATELSRGFLVRDYLVNNVSTGEYLEKLKKEGRKYNGFSLIFGDLRRLCFFSNRQDAFEDILPGIHGQSNHLLDTPWPKVQRGKEAMQEILSCHDCLRTDELLGLLADGTVAENHLLPDTGVGIEQERLLSPIFVKGPNYGTMSSTLFFVDYENNVTFIERTYGGNTSIFSTLEFKFRLGS